jgi:hypothetical protein
MIKSLRVLRIAAVAAAAGLLACMSGAALADTFETIENAPLK